MMKRMLLWVVLLVVVVLVLLCLGVGVGVGVGVDLGLVEAVAVVEDKMPTTLLRMIPMPLLPGLTTLIGMSMIGITRETMVLALDIMTMVTIIGRIMIGIGITRETMGAAPDTITIVTMIMMGTDVIAMIIIIIIIITIMVPPLSMWN